MAINLQDLLKTARVLLKQKSAGEPVGHNVNMQGFLSDVVFCLEILGKEFPHIAVATIEAAQPALVDAVDVEGVAR